MKNTSALSPPAALALCHNAAPSGGWKEKRMKQRFGLDNVVIIIVIINIVERCILVPLVTILFFYFITSPRAECHPLINCSNSDFYAISFFYNLHCLRWFMNTFHNSQWIVRRWALSICTSKGRLLARAPDNRKKWFNSAAEPHSIFPRQSPAWGTLSKGSEYCQCWWWCWSAPGPDDRWEEAGESLHLSGTPRCHNLTTAKQY